MSLVALLNVPAPLAVALRNSRGLGVHLVLEFFAILVPTLFATVSWPMFALCRGAGQRLLGGALCGIEFAKGGTVLQGGPRLGLACIQGCLLHSWAVRIWPLVMWLPVLIDLVAANINPWV